MGCFLFDCVGGFTLTVFRWAIFVVNVIFLLDGVALITMSTIMFINNERYFFYYTLDAKINLIICFVAGCLTIFASVFGFVGAKIKSSWMMYTYAGLLFVTSVISLVGGIRAVVNDHYPQQQINSNMIELMERYPAPGAEGDNYARDAWDNLHAEYRCCGITNITDWINYRPDLSGYPVTCKCEKGSEGCGAIGPNFYFSAGCSTRVGPYLTYLMNTLGGITIALAILELAAGIISINLANSFKKRKDESRSSSVH